jgi:hypothetical protein
MKRGDRHQRVATLDQLIERGQSIPEPAALGPLRRPAGRLDPGAGEISQGNAARRGMTRHHADAVLEMRRQQAADAAVVPDEVEHLHHIGQDRRGGGRHAAPGGPAEGGRDAPPPFDELVVRGEATLERADAAVAPPPLEAG